MFKRIFSAGLLLFALVFLAALHASAQSITSGDVTGTVTDPSGAALPNAAVTLTNTATGTAQQATTDSHGGFRFAFIAPGTYTIQVTASGFQTQAHNGVVVAAGQPTAANFQLAISAASQTVNVSEQGSILQNGKLRHVDGI